jgi:hypothetical protein
MRIFCFFALTSTIAANADDIIGGSGKYKFRYRPDLAQLPSSEINDDMNGHGLAFDRKNDVFYFTWQPKKLQSTSHALARFSGNGNEVSLLGIAGPDGLSAGTPHGLRLEEEYLYHANNVQRVTKTNLDGEIVWTTSFTEWNVSYPQFWPILPTDAIPVPGSDLLLLADGYGSSYIHFLNKTDGTFIEGMSFGGLGNATSPNVQFHTPHSVSLDHQYSAKYGCPVFAVSDRSNNRIVWVNTSGHVFNTRSTLDTSPLPCNVDFSTSNGAALVPSLGLDYSNLTRGRVTIYEDLTNSKEAASTIEIAELIGDQGHQHPHDAIWLANGDVVVCCWSGPADPGLGPALGTISYWERI